MTRARDLADSADKDIAGTLTLDDIVLSNDLTVADNGKAIFGAGSDLQIYHDGSNSYIDDNGTGDLRIRAESFLALSDMSNRVYLTGTSQGAVGLRFNDAQKLATTATGIDVTGTVTADGLTVDGSATISNASGDTLTLAKDTTEPSFRIEGDANKDFVFTISGELLTLTQNDGATDIVTFDHDTKASSFFGNVGIGTSSPSTFSNFTNVTLQGGSAGVNLDFKDSGGDRTHAIVSTPSEFIVETGNTDPLIFKTNNLERFRVTSDGDVTIGTTDTQPPTNNDASGIALRSDGKVAASRSGGISGDFNRGSDGDIVWFRKSGSVAGVIGAFGDNPYFSSYASNHGGLIFSDGGSSTPQMNPLSSGSTLADGVMNIGSSSYRFKDLYLSGGVYLGGTASANHLDDYEEGTFTPTGNGITFTSAIGRYTKIGNIVRVGMYVEFPSTSDSGDARINALPFTCSNTEAARAGLTVAWHNKSSSNGLAILTTNNNTFALFYLGSQFQTNANMSGVAVYIGGTYPTDS